MTEAGIQVVNHIDEPYFTVPRDLARDARLTMSGFRLYVYLRSHANGWEITYSQISAETGMKRDAIRSAIKNLGEMQLLSVTQPRRADNTFSKLRWELSSKSPVTVYPVTVDPDDGLSAGGESTSLENNLKKTNTKNNIKEEATEIFFEEFWEHYPKKEGKQSSITAFKKALKLVTAKELIEAAKNYALATKNTEKRYIRKAYNWLKDEDFLNQEKPKQQGGGIWDQNPI